MTMLSVEAPPQKKQAVAVTLIGLFLALVTPELIVRMVPSNGHGISLIRQGSLWALSLILILYVVAVEKRPLASIGFRRLSWHTLLCAVAAGVITVLGIAIIYGVVFPIFHLKLNNQAISQLMTHSFRFRLLVVLGAGFCEELLYRGYAIERLAELTGSRVTAAIIAWAAFTTVHLSYWGAAQLIVAGFGGAMLTALYLWRRDLPCNMLAHFLTDAPAFLLG